MNTDYGFWVCLGVYDKEILIAKWEYYMREIKLGFTVTVESFGKVIRLKLGLNGAGAMAQWVK